MSMQKKLRNRLDDLFSDLEEQVVESSTIDVDILPGWTWECDPQGIYTKCSPEIENVLGVPPQNFIGQSIYRHRLDDESVEKLHRVFEVNDLPSETLLQYQGKNGKPIKVRAHLFPIESIDSTQRGWRGFNHVMKTGVEVPSILSPLTTLPKEPLQDQITQLAQLITMEVEPGQDQPARVSSLLTPAIGESIQGKEIVATDATPQSPATLAIPVELQDQFLGILEIIDDTPGRKWSDDEKRLVEQVVDQLALALENARLFQEEQHRRRIADTLSKTARVVGSTLELEDVGDRLLNQLAETIDFEIATLQIMDRDQRRLISGLRISNKGFEKLHPRILTPISGDVFIRAIIENQQPLFIPDTLLESQWIDTPETDNVRSWIGTPLTSGNETIGLLTLAHPEPGFYDEDIMDLIGAIAAQVSVAIRNAGLFQQIQRRSIQLQTAAEVSRAASSILEPNPLIQQAADLIRDRFDLYYVGIFLIDQTGDWTNEPGKWAVLRAGTGEAGRIQIERGHRLAIDSKSMIGECVLSTQAQTPRSISEETPRFINPLLPDTRTEIALPLISRGKVIGAMSIQSEIENAFSDEDVSILQTMADQVANALQNASLFDQTQARAGELVILNEMSHALSQNLDAEEIIGNIYLYASKLIDTSTFFLALYDQDGGVISFPIATEGNRELEIPVRRLGEGLTEYVIRNRQAVLIHEDVEGWLKKHKVEIRITGAKSQSWLGVPMVIGEQTLGVICVQSQEPYKFSERHRDLLNAIASQCAIALQNAHLFAETQRRVRDLTTISSTSETLATALQEVTTVAQIITQQVGGTLSGKTTASISLQDLSNPDYMRTIISTSRQEGKLIPDENPEKWDFKLSDYPATNAVFETFVPLLIHVSNQNADPAELTYMQENGIGSLLVIPLIVKGQTIGVMELETWGEEYHYNQEEIDLLITLGNQGAIALENARLYEEQFHSAEQLRELDRLKSQFLANMSHELRTPLNSIIGFSRVIMKGIDGPVTDLQQQDLSAIFNAGQHLLKMINDILDISKIDAGRMELAFEEINIVDVIDSVMSTARGLVKDKPIQLVTALEDDLPLINADPTRIRQVLLNLLSNAAKFTDEGSITVTARQQINTFGQPEIYLSVADTGIGIAPEDQDSLFEPFTQVDGSPTRATGGTGLGLSITRMLVDLHNGKIGLESDVGNGSNFYVTLPLSETKPSALNMERSSAILAIDDDIQVIQLYERYLSDTSYQIIPLSDPSSALAYAREIQPFLITLDILLPNYDGWKLLEELKSDPETGHIPIIVCSIVDEIDKGLAMGVDQYLVKPILADDFVYAVNRIKNEVNTNS